MSRFQFSCINCGCHIPRQSNNLDAGFEISCWSCNTINIIPNLSEISTVTPTDNNVVNTQSRLNCSNCQTILNQDSNYCSNCGISLHTNDRQKGKKDNSKKITNKTKEKKQTNRLMGFIMVVAYFQSCVAIILFLANIQTDIIPDRATALVMSGFTFSIGYGIHHRKSWGLYLLYFLCIVGSMGCISMVFERKPEYFFGLIVNILYWIYFSKRKHLFTN